jgi:hypothetical protein
MKEAKSEMKEEGDDEKMGRKGNTGKTGSIDGGNGLQKER